MSTAPKTRANSRNCGLLRHVAGKPDSVAMRTVAAALAALLVLPAPQVDAAQLQPRTLGAFQTYVRLTEAQIDAQSAHNEPFLWVERLPAERRAVAEKQLRQGKVVIEHLATLDGGKPISCPGGMIHHWIGTVFIPGATLVDTLAIVRDYDHHQTYYAPDVSRSKILRHNGNTYLVYYRFYKKKVITSVEDTNHEVQYTMLDATHALSRSHTVRVQQVDHAGAPTERLLPEGQGDGLLWKINTYWRFEQRDSGTYVECQSISLTRDIPTGLGWLIRSYVTSVPRESLTFTLTKTRSAVLARIDRR
jgi:hypothetical protein